MMYPLIALTLAQENHSITGITRLAAKPQKPVMVIPMEILGL